MKGKKMSLKERIAKLDVDKNERRKLFKALCDHLSEGLSIESFSEVTDHTIYRYLKQFPEEFDKDELDIAKKKGRVWWESIGKAQSSGNCIGNSRSWYYNMANRYGWREKLDIEAEHKGSINVNVVSYASKKASQDDESKDRT
jgi:hypothetical protein